MDEKNLIKRVIGKSMSPGGVVRARTEREGMNPQGVVQSRGCNPGKEIVSNLGLNASGLISGRDKNAKIFKLVKDG